MSPNAPFVAITGTNGKSTTTALIAHLLRDGRPRRPARRQYRHRDPVARAAARGPRPRDRGVVLPDRSRAVARSVGRHPDQRHARTISTATARSRTTPPSRSGWSPACRTAAPRSSASTTTGARPRPTASSARASACVRVSVRRPLADGLYVEAEQIMQAAGGTARAIAHLGGIGSLRGVHNAQNAACATRRRARARAVGRTRSSRACARSRVSRTAWSRSAARAACCSSTTPRRPTRIRRRRRSPASPTSSGSPAASRRPAAFARSTGFFPRIRKAYLIGEAAADFAAELEGQVPHVVAGTLDRAVALAARDAEAADVAEPVVLLSPACASFDQYPQFRGARRRVPRTGAGAAGRGGHSIGGTLVAPAGWGAISESVPSGQRKTPAGCPAGAGGFHDQVTIMDRSCAASA